MCEILRTFNLPNIVEFLCKLINYNVDWFSDGFKFLLAVEKIFHYYISLPKTKENGYLNVYRCSNISAKNTTT